MGERNVLFGYNLSIKDYWRRSSMRMEEMIARFEDSQKESLLGDKGEQYIQLLKIVKISSN